MIHFFDSDVAVKVGIAGAVILQAIADWIEYNRANEQCFRDGRTWVCNTIKAFTNQFPYLTKRQVEWALKKLQQDGYILSTHDGSRNNVTWYAFTSEDKRFHMDVKPVSHECETSFTNLGNFARADICTYNNSTNNLSTKSYQLNSNPLTESYYLPDNLIQPDDLNNNPLSESYYLNHHVVSNREDVRPPDARAHECVRVRESLPNTKKIILSFDYEGDMKFHGITEDKKRYWSEHYPTLDIDKELLQMEAWLASHTNNRKKRIEVFINNWLTYATNRSNNNGQGRNGQQIQSEHGSIDDFHLKHRIATQEEYERAYANDLNANGKMPF